MQAWRQKEKQAATPEIHLSRSVSKQPNYESCSPFTYCETIHKKRPIQFHCEYNSRAGFVSSLQYVRIGQSCSVKITGEWVEFKNRQTVPLQQLISICLKFKWWWMAMTENNWHCNVLFSPDKVKKVKMFSIFPQKNHFLWHGGGV